MTERLLGCQPPRRDGDITSASFHPELLVGDLVMRPRIHVGLAPADQAVVSEWSRRLWGMIMVMFLVLGTWSIL